jgi:flagella basal body P-ring formation protein FlgA
MQRIPPLAIIVFLVGLATYCESLLAGHGHDLDRVRETAVQFARQQLAGQAGEIQVEGAAVDARLQLTPCAELEAYLPPGTRLWGRSHVAVRCLRPERWSLVVPITVRIMGDAVFTARPLARGLPVEPADLDIRRVDLTALPAGVLTHASQALQRVPGVSLQAGLALRADMLRGAVVVSTGQVVKILAAGEGFIVTSEGSALGNGAVGDILPVRSASGRVLKVVVTSPGVVEVR